MLYYVGVFFILFFGALKYDLKKNKKEKRGYFIIFMIIFVLAFNYQMGSDWLNYQDFYDNFIPKIGFQDLYNGREIPFLSEKGYILLNIFFYKLGFSYEMFSGIVLTICIFIILRFVKRKSDNYFVAYYILIVNILFGFSMEPIMRQFLATSIVVLAFNYIEKKKFIKYFLLIMLAAQFHNSAYICIFFYFLDKFTIKRRKVLYLVLVSYLIVLIIPSISEKLMSISILSKYMYYINHPLYGFRKISFSRSILKLLISLVYLYINFYSYQFSKKKERYLQNLSIIYCLFFVLDGLPILQRLLSYFSVGFAISISSIGELKTLSKKEIKLNHRKVGYINIIILFVFNIFIFYKTYFVRELSIYRYYNYKNYFIEGIKGNLYSDFETKSYQYKIDTLKLQEKENMSKN